MRFIPRTAALSFTTVAILVAAACVSPARSAHAAELKGIADQGTNMFASPYFQQIDSPISRLVVSYDAVLRNTAEVANIDAWLRAARESGIEPLIAFEHGQGCYDGVGVVRSKRCRLPTTARFRAALRAFQARYPFVTDYSPWNEANHRSQPTAKRPDRAASFYNVTRQECPDCSVVAVDVLDAPGMTRYVKAFRRHAVRPPTIWGLHNYRDTNSGKSTYTRALLGTVRGEVWLTETGGLVKLGHSAFGVKGAKKAVKYMFRLARMSPRIKRLYIYNWTGLGGRGRFDSGLTSPAGNPRPAYYVVRNNLGMKPPPPPAPPPSLRSTTPPMCVMVPALCS
ncbi:MAG: hypothetical protein QOG15_1793 [Solirubrobacteraceae bacterium]|jgi:hypothetical protein|nr:hypothetical protein [Solirubrobacteraceae bacterium]